MPPRFVPELVMPAGSPEKLRAALHFGADAVYLGLKRFSLRAAAGNFTEDELAWALSHARERGRRVYVTVNVQPYDEEFAELEPTLALLDKLRPDGVVVADPGVFAVARRVAPGLALHLSTQASVINAESADFWFGLGMRRIVLARELSLERLARLAARASGPLEVFAHGAMCVAYSGRCFLSLYWAGPQRDPRHGSCAQPCRWPYRAAPPAAAVEEANYPGRVHELEQDERGTYFFDSRDLCALPVLDRLVATGVHALKVEGRTRSLHYVAVVADVYRRALDALARGEAPDVAAGLAELQRASKRPFSTHFLGGEENEPATYLPQGSPVGGEAVLAGVVVAAAAEHVDIEVRNPLRPGALLELRDRGGLAEPAQAVALADTAGTPLAIARPGTVIRLPGRYRAGVGALARLRR